MPLVIESCTDADMRRITDIIFDAFGDEHIYIDAVFPNKNTPAGRASACTRFTAMKDDPAARFLKVTDTETGEIIAMANWNIYEDPTKKPEEVDLDGDFWENEEEKAFAKHLFAKYLEPRRKAIREATGPLLALNLLAVDPKQQYRGAGAMLVKWGTQYADKINAECTVEASNQGRHLYETCGFFMRRHITLEVPQKWADRQKQRYFWMERPAQVLTDSA